MLNDHRQKAVAAMSHFGDRDRLLSASLPGLSGYPDNAHAAIILLFLQPNFPVLAISGVCYLAALLAVTVVRGAQARREEALEPI